MLRNKKKNKNRVNKVFYLLLATSKGILKQHASEPPVNPIRTFRQNSKEKYRWTRYPI